MNVFLTGATGYIGSVVAEQLKDRGHTVAGLARTDEAAARLLEKGVAPVRGALADEETLARAAAAADAVVHTAFGHDFAAYDAAVATERRVIETFAGALRDTNKPLVATTGAAFLGDTRDAAADEDHPYDRDSPFYSRGAAEQDALRLSAKGIRSVVLRLPLFVYGRAGSSFVPFLIEHAKKAGAAFYLGAGAQKVSAVHVEDAADLYVTALETSTAKGLYNVAAETVTLRELAEAVGRLAGVPARSIDEPTARAEFGPLYGFLSISSRLAAEKARAALEWAPPEYRSILDDIEHGSYRRPAAAKS